MFFLYYGPWPGPWHLRIQYINNKYWMCFVPSVFLVFGLSKMSDRLSQRPGQGPQGDGLSKRQAPGLALERTYNSP